MARSIRAAGGRPGDRVHVAYGYGLFTGGLGAHYGAEALGCTVIPVSGGMTERQVMLIRDFEPDVVMVTPSYMLAIVDEMERQGIDPRTYVAAGRHLRRRAVDRRHAPRDRGAAGHARRRHLRAVRGDGPGRRAGVRGDTKDGLHIWEDHFYPEVVDPITGEVLPDGELGELVFTSLTKQAMPVVRYRTRDLTRLLPGTARPMRRMEKVTGRSDDMIILRGVNLFPTQIEELDPAHPRAVAALPVRAAPRRPAGLDDGAGRAPAGCVAGRRPVRAGRELAGRVKATIGVTRRGRGGGARRHRAVGREDAPHRRRAVRREVAARDAKGERFARVDWYAEDLAAPACSSAASSSTPT